MPTSKFPDCVLSLSCMASFRAKPYTGPVTKQKRLNVVRPRDTKLGRATIMDRALAQRYGAPYVHLAAFAIDVDRVHRSRPDAPGLPDGCEVSDRAALQVWRPRSSGRRMLERCAVRVMELPAHDIWEPGGQCHRGLCGRRPRHSACRQCFQAWLSRRSTLSPT